MCIRDSWKIVKCQQRAEWDRDLYRRMPKTADIQAGVKQAYCTVKAAFDKYSGAEAMPARVWARVNEAVVFALTYDTFCGRRGEWEKMLLKDMKKALAEKKNWIQCKEHKTYKTYGDIAKWLSPSLFEMFSLYVQLPRDGSEAYPYLIFCLLYTSPSPRDS